MTWRNGSPPDAHIVSLVLCGWDQAQVTQQPLVPQAEHVGHEGVLVGVEGAGLGVRFRIALLYFRGRFRACADIALVKTCSAWMIAMRAQTPRPQSWTRLGLGLRSG